MSLRLRLLLALVGLVAAGLLVAGAVTYSSLRSFLIARIDQQLVAAQGPVANVLQSASSSLPGFPGGVQRADMTLPSGTYGGILDSTGRTVIRRVFSYGGSLPAAPSLSRQLVRQATRVDQLFASVRASTSAGPRYRLVTARSRDGDYVLVVAIPLSEVSRTLGRLLLIEILVTAGVLVGLALLAWWIVHREMRPLEDMAATAGAIAAGDLARRVEPAEPRTEVGRLGLALNAMLAQIERAFDRRKASEEKLRRFLADASHELRTPLVSIRGYAELFHRGAKDRPEDLALAMDRIEQEASRMGVLVDELLLLARLDEGRPLELASVDLAKVAADTVSDARVAEPDRRVDVAAEGPAPVVGDDARLRQLAANLVANALQHTGPEAHVQVSVSLEDNTVLLEVTDDGPGMSEEEAGHAFEPFYRPDTARGAGGGGVGLGLAIVAAIAHAHGGDVAVETSPGEGARFRVRLPAAPPDDTE